MQDTAPTTLDERADHRHVPQVLATALSIRQEIEALNADEDVIRDTLEGEVDLDGLLDFLINGLAYDEAMQSAIKGQITTLETRKIRLEARIERQRALLRQTMEISGWRKRERPAATLTLAPKAPALGPINEAQIPVPYWIESDPKLDRKALLEDLKAGKAIPGARLEDPALVLKIRRG